MAFATITDPSIFTGTTSTAAGDTVSASPPAEVRVVNTDNKFFTGGSYTVYSLSNGTKQYVAFDTSGNVLGTGSTIGEAINSAATVGKASTEYLTGLAAAYSAAGGTQSGTTGIGNLNSEALAPTGDNAATSIPPGGGTPTGIGNMNSAALAPTGNNSATAIPSGGPTNDYYNTAATESGYPPDPSASRLAAAGLKPGGIASTQPPGVQTATTINTSATSAAAQDWRITVKLAQPSLFNIISGSGLMAPLAPVGGVTFPYVPQIAIQHNARYSEQAATHSNYKNYFYEGSDVAPMTISGDFTVQNVSEGLSLIHI